MNLTVATSLDFELPDELAAHEPVEARGLARDAVRLMVSRVGDDTIDHTTFRELPDFLAADDLLVVNSSATINAAFRATRESAGGEPVRLHLSTPLSDNWWLIELRRLHAGGHDPLFDAAVGESIRLPGAARATLVVPLSRHVRRLWLAEVTLPEPTLAYAAQHGAPIRYDYVPRSWPLRDYQTIFANEPGSVEMPSAARPFTREVVARLLARGAGIAPIVLHTGVSSLEADETPYPERYSVPLATAQLINDTHRRGGRVIAVGTTAVRAIETVALADGRVRADAGWTNLVITPERGLYAVDGLLTGLHAPNASHLWMLEALAGRDHLALCYEAALEQRYLWHEFGDVHLIMR